MRWMVMKWMGMKWITNEMNWNEMIEFNYDEWIDSEYDGSGAVPSASGRQHGPGAGRHGLPQRDDPRLLAAFNDHFYSNWKARLPSNSNR